MKFDKYKKPFLCASKEETRYAITDIGVVSRGANRAWLAATDGRMMTLVAAEFEDGDSIPLTTGYASTVVHNREAVKAAVDAALKAKTPKPAEARLKATVDNAEVTTREGATMAWKTIKDTRFPDIESVLPGPNQKVLATIMLDAEKLATIAKSLGVYAVKLEIRDPNLPVMVRPIYLESSAVEDGSFGMLMPIADS